MPAGLLLGLGVMIITTILFVGGAALLWTGWRGVVRDWYPRCRRCLYNLAGLTDPEQCPECAGPLVGADRIIVGHRRRQVGRLLGGLVMMFFAAFTVAVVSFQPTPPPVVVAAAAPAPAPLVGRQGPRRRAPITPIASEPRSTVSPPTQTAVVSPAIHRTSLDLPRGLLAPPTFDRSAGLPRPLDEITGIPFDARPIMPTVTITTPGWTRFDFGSIPDAPRVPEYTLSRARHRTSIPTSTPSLPTFGQPLGTQTPGAASLTTAWPATPSRIQAIRH